MITCVLCRVEFKLPVGQKKTDPCPRCDKVEIYSRLGTDMLLAKILVELERMNK